MLLQNPTSNIRPRSDGKSLDEKQRRRNTGYLPSLDGWRAVAILGVVMYHDQIWRLGPFTNEGWKYTGAWGVNLFFALSGILICWRILEEEHVKGTFRVRDFYIRRFLRIQPAAWLYLATVAFLIAVGLIHERWHFWRGALLLYENFLGPDQTQPAASYFSGHFWTLSVEEHFYIILSIFLVWLKRYRVAVLGSVLACLFWAQHLVLSRHRAWALSSTHNTFWQIQELLLPALLALLLYRIRVRDVARRFFFPWVVFWGWVVCSYLHWTLRSRTVPFFSSEALHWELGHLPHLFVFFVVATMLHPESWTTRILEWAPLRYVGRLSYSLYLWHVVVLAPLQPSAYISWAPLVWLSQRPWRYVAMAALAWLSYRFVEKPIMRLGHKLAPPSTPGHRDMAVERTPTAQQFAPRTA